MPNHAAMHWVTSLHRLWPTRCAFCGNAQSQPVCAPCREDLPWLSAAFDLEPLDTARAPLAYAFPVDAAIKRLKFRRSLSYVPAFAALLQEAIGGLPGSIDALLPMPLHWRRQALRGFNQAAEIAGAVRATTGLPLIRNVVRARHTPYQSGLTAAQRRRNLRGAFRVRGPVGCRHALIIDDVITTGSTCRQLARVLQDAGVPAVSALAIARVPGA
jgi:ComF family protein